MPVIGSLEIMEPAAEAGSPMPARLKIGELVAPDRIIGQVAPGRSIQCLHHTHLGSTRVITDETGAVVSQHKHPPFGEEFTDAGADQVNSHKFTGHERDRRTGLDYMFARYYSPESTFRFLSVDPKRGSARRELPSTWNRYSYVLNNPLALVDLDGLDVYTHLIKDEVIRAEAEAIAAHPDMQAIYGPGTGNDLWIVDYEVNPGDVVEVRPDGTEIVNEAGESYTSFQIDPESGSTNAVSVIDPRNNDGTEKATDLKQQHVQEELGHAYLTGSRERDTHGRAKAEGKRMSGEVKDGRSMEEHDRQIDETIRQNRERREKEKKQ